MKCKCASCPTHACYTKGVNCTGVPHEEVKAAYTEEELKNGEYSGVSSGSYNYGTVSYTHLTLPTNSRV